MIDRRKALEDALRDVNAVFESASLIERKQYKLQANLEDYGREINSIESRVNDSNNRPY